MSIKEQVEFAKEELTQDEKLLSGLIKVERFYKRNRLAILAVAVLVVVGGIGYGVMGYLKEQQLLRANAAFLQLQKNPSDKGALETLKKENPPLARLVLLQHATQAGDVSTLETLAESKDEVVSDLARYHLGVWKKSAETIKNYRMQSEALLKDFAIFDEAYLLMKAGEVSQAKERLAMIADSSPLKAAARMLNHYGIAASGKKEGSR
ncbi:hypothetical protein [Hydrogenimonas cancrithermarum]|uniref:Tetratricopeptide repeat-like domain-containing protein n=1 Tax=Hydrogenimonas cancrithermarum TaxID=2993563 RepID=A0ABM8FLF6_9BACT|nr:hypothetical protein [Hydrogenimonas cancrithermarum]BDY12282.1 hypothetical protein HCR_05940 [Hydrogenimonas cancrithermarum]